MESKLNNIYIYGIRRWIIVSQIITNILLNYFVRVRDKLKEKSKKEHNKI